jgi:uncharacterized protein YacL
MQISLSFTRILFLGLCILFITSYAITAAPDQSYIIRIIVGVIAGFLFGALVISMDTLFKRFNLRAFNLAALGLFFGYLMGEIVLLAFQAVLNITTLNISPQYLSLVNTSIFLFTIYLGMVMTIRASDELYVSIPFIKFKPSSQKKKDLILDTTILLDSRLTDLASSGLLDHHLIVPRFLIKDCYEMCENSDEIVRSKARRILDVIKKLESIPSLDLRYTDADFPEYKDLLSKLVRLAKLLDANILSADSNRMQHSNFEGVLIINIHTLSSALKPVAQTGEFISIKIQRYGKEARQGVGYLDDGTMVVVNGGAEYIGDVIRAQVLSVKHTSSGRMIFSNVLEEDTEALSSLPSECESSAAKNYFAL